MEIQRVTLRLMSGRMREPFVTSFGSEQDKTFILVEVTTDSGATGFAECTASTDPLYSEETNSTAWPILRDFLVPILLEGRYDTIDDLHGLRQRMAQFKGNKMAKAAAEMAVWDAWSAETQTPLSSMLGGTKDEIPVGISVGIQPDVRALLRKIEGYIEQGFQRFKVKIKPGWDIGPLSEIRRTFGDIPLMADANSAYRLSDMDRLRELDQFGLMMIEQPLANDDIIDHATLQRQLKTHICLDESIHSAEDARKAIEIGACGVINIKLGRVGGFSEAVSIHNVCKERDIPVWCGGMLETGIGRLHNIALTALPGFTLPGDTAPSARYFEQDLIEPAVTFYRPGVLAVESICGVAARVIRERVDAWTVETQYFE